MVPPHSLLILMAQVRARSTPKAGGMRGCITLGDPGGKWAKEGGEKGDERAQRDRKWRAGDQCGEGEGDLMK